jgi:4'-phosphopantetheinyl transferase EntD
VLRDLLPRSVAVVVAEPGDDDVPLLPAERRFVEHAAAVRRRHFAAGRTCARAALRQLGHPAVAVPLGAERAPVWPTGVVGSITHCEGFTAAAVAWRRDVTLLGIDTEVASALDEDVVGAIASADELAAAHAELGPDAGAVIFSAKESIYKAWYPATDRWLGFESVIVVLDRRGTFRIEPSVALEPADRDLLASLAGRFAVGDGRVATAAFRTSSSPPR